MFVYIISYFNPSLGASINLATSIASTSTTPQKRLSNRYDVQHGRIIDMPRMNRLFLSPNRPKCRPSIVSSSVFHLPPVSPTSMHRLPKELSINQQWNDRPQPLSSTRLSCAASPESRPSRQFHKSVDDLLMSATKPSGKKDEPTEQYQPSMNRTQSSDDLCEPDKPKDGKKPSKPSGFSARMKNMSARTQQIFQRLYNQSSAESEVTPIEPPSLRPKPRSRLVGGSIYRSGRSMSQGNMLDALDGRGSCEKMESLFYLPLELETNKFEVPPDDSDSGILVNESGQSSIVDVHEEERLNKVATCDAEMNEFVATAFR